MKLLVKLGITNMLVLGSVLFAYSFENTSYHIASKNSTSFDLSKEESDKNINNVKVVYNPVVQQINLSFKLSKQTNVSVKLMDALGNEVLGLMTSTSLESGNQNHSFDIGEKVAAGFYFVRVSSGTETVVKRISIR